MHANRLEQVHRANKNTFKRLDGLVKGKHDRRLAGEVVYLVGGDLGNHLHRRSKVDELHRLHTNAVVNADDCIAVAEQVRGKVSAVLSGDAADQRSLAISL